MKLLTAEALRRLPLPALGENSDKEARGRVLVVASSRRVPGAAVLSGLAALRAGAGKLKLAVPQSLAIPLGLAIMEAGIVALAENAEGDPRGEAASDLMQAARGSDAVLIGPGIMDEESCGALTRALLDNCRTGFVLDAGALACLAGAPEALRRQDILPIVTPHAGEMASMMGIEKEKVEADPPGIAAAAARQLNAIVVLKGARSFIACPSGELWENRHGAVGLGTSGSGDVLAGIIAGLAARGAPPLHAALWGVFLHAQAGEQLEQSIGRLGFLAREILAEIPRILARLEAAP